MHTRINFILHSLALYSAFQFPAGCASDAIQLSPPITTTGNSGSSGSGAVGSSASVFLQAPHPPYKPINELVKCDDPLCVAFHWPAPPICGSPNQCDYGVEYADEGRSSGVLVKDSFPLRYSNGTVTEPRVAFGCGSDQEVPNGVTPPYLDGILGLGLGKVGILSQLQELGVTKNVVGHCFSSQGDGYLFFGDEVVLITWIPYTETDDHYSLGTAEVFVGDTTSGMKDLPIMFDSGSTYTYLARTAYEVIVSLLMNDIKEKPLINADDDNTLPICWKGSKPFNSIQDVKSLFQPIVLSFSNPKTVRFQIDPEGYLIISEHGNVCLGILDGTEVGLDEFNLIGGNERVTWPDVRIITLKETVYTT
ncbi:hypothetical protein SSX86_014153 [Deinandra increscens subsp. villosa]|uniref:Peptidase A1 domain-containing protein n=1 Tax=Deinandra increscens subsp. villosa TaxID=3103831 RepID=A0AAP0D619_9ASTR